MNKNTIKNYISVLENITAFFKTQLEQETSFLASTEKKLIEFANLKALSKQDKWPEAVPSESICDDNDDDCKLTRAANIMRDIRVDLNNRRFLDFGCGEGHVPYVVGNLTNAIKSVGYDIKNSNWDNFDKTDSVILTTNWEQVKANGPYDVISIYDVLDHANDPKEILQKVKEVKTPDSGSVRLRCHPWCSRHGTHLYKQLNKAYLQLVFTEDEIYGMGLQPIKTHRFLDPIASYRKLIQESGFKIFHEQPIIQTTDIFFMEDDVIKKRIIDNWKESDNIMLANGSLFPRDITQIQFVDYILI